MELQVENVHLYERQNAEEHRTVMFEQVHAEVPRAVLRRGQPFFLAIRFNRDLAPEDVVTLIFTLGPEPHAMRDTLGRMRLAPWQADGVEFDDHAYKWESRITAMDVNTITVEVRSPADAPVGEWQVIVETIDGAALGAPDAGPAYAFPYQHPVPVSLLFNPWEKHDSVYMEETALLDEFVLNDVGKVWVGPMGFTKGREWVFGQFDERVLPAALMVLERTGIPHSERGDPVRMSRALTKLVNANDDGGVLIGRWDGQYEDGTAPSCWTGSVAILEEYLNTGVSVRYGQCWIFAGVLCTLCRVLGLPARVVSCLVSAHDANSSLSVDRFYSDERDELPWDPLNPSGGKDSIWNYHVWTDVWMARPDLPSGYGGWQACDATPQETSDSFYQCGPASLEAIRRGEVGLKYDVPFMLASVNADVIRWIEDPSSDLGFTRIDSNKYHIGRRILTKTPFIFDHVGDDDCDDIIDLYKAPEGTNMERISLLNAVRGSARAKRFYDVPPPEYDDVSFTLNDIDKIQIGEPFAVEVHIENRSGQERLVRAALSAGSVYYTGVKAHIVKKASGDFLVQPYASDVLRLTVEAEEYIDKMVEYNNMKIFALASVDGTKQTWAAEDDFQITVPTLNITVLDQPTVGESCSVVFEFQNPLQLPLTDCSLRSEGPGLVRNSVLTYRDVMPGETLRIEQRIWPQRAGSLKLVAAFSARELINVTGSVLVEVVE
ncbi:hemocyte protein-glutamine gamma-glutamyltransferase-like [Frankliniella occidentalis]|uniref:Hemocyte protein-glutamine gamma-glutamyltransferase-like n=1 Tax=Frankliniella occidentalis TaxID=133901 RepID=A0A6J1SSJ5_FRAOC|nr:hemocyte protein-glutamine gamma-glutamyltransferase-like [Frankliniella occidentalis]